MTPAGGASETKTKVGWTLGGGVDYAFMGAWSVKLEYLYADLCAATVCGSAPDIKLKTNLVRAGLTGAGRSAGPLLFEAPWSAAVPVIPTRRRTSGRGDWRNAPVLTTFLTVASAPLSPYAAGTGQHFAASQSYAQRKRPTNP